MRELEAYKRLVEGGRKGGSAKVPKGFASDHVQKAAQEKRLKNNVMKSLLVKSIRLGWVAGIEKARQELKRSDFESVCVAQIFEDLWPSTVDEIKELVNSFKSGNYAEVCSFGTHHGVKGLTSEIMDLAQKIKVDKDKCFDFLAKHELRTSPRAFKCLSAWLATEPVKVNRREPDLTPWHDDLMPSMVLDCHVGKWRGTKILTGTFEGHVELSKMVDKEGWEYVREKFHADKEQDRWTQKSLCL